MALRLSLDTSFLIDLQRERLKSERDGPAHRFLRRHADAELFLSTVALGEFAEGFADTEDAIVRAVREQHTLVAIDEATALTYAGILRRLRRSGRLIGTNDLWIGVSSLTHGLAVVTANPEHFRRIDGLHVIAHREQGP
ncbi:MAG: PIN domain-containing protein [Gemmatimonas sp.]|nr:PIN domain-containing protein [Gemmatimonas sp.]